MVTHSEHYNRVLQAIHWVTALVLLALLSVGYYMASMEFSPLKLDIYMIHKSLGMTIFALVLVRIVWRFIKPAPKPLLTHTHWEKVLSKLVHLLLYAGMIGMPLSGWVMSSAAEFPNSYFGLFEFPALSAKNEELFRVMRMVHELTALMLILAVGLHFLGAAKHHIIDKDATLRRMGGNSVFLFVGGALLVAASLFAGSKLMDIYGRVQFVANAPHSALDVDHVAVAHSDSDAALGMIDQTSMVWSIDHERSALKIVFAQYGQSVNAAFDKFEGKIAFDPDDLSRSAVVIRVDVASLKTGSDDRDAQARSQDWFAADTFSHAVFESESFEVFEADADSSPQYRVKGFLTMRDQRLPVEFPFTLAITQDPEDAGFMRAVMRANLTLMRLDFGVGQGQWQSTDAIDNAVQIDTELHAIYRP